MNNHNQDVQENRTDSLTGFERFRFDVELPKLTISYHGLEFDANVKSKLGFPKYCRIHLDYPGKRIAIQGLDEGLDDCILFCKGNDLEKPFVVDHARLIHQINTNFELFLSKTSSFKYSCFGVYHPDERAIIFGIRNAIVELE